jgi:hypothetical protein
MSASPTPRIVLTGGPCAGKSTALARVHAHLEAHGLKVYRVPEAATLILSGGVEVKDAPLEYMLSFQRGIVRVQLALEAAFDGFARTAGARAVLLCDRGVMDGAAYLPGEAWAELLAGEGLDEADLCERRYTAVIHLVTAAHGVEDSYGTHTNAVRYEDVAGARDVDQRLQLVWRGHPRLRVIETHPDFEVKMRRVVAVASELVGVPTP